MDLCCYECGYLFKEEEEIYKFNWHASRPAKHYCWLCAEKIRSRTNITLKPNKPNISFKKVLAYLFLLWFAGTVIFGVSDVPNDKAPDITLSPLVSLVVCYGVFFGLLGAVVILAE